MMNSSLAICKHPEHSWCLCWVTGVDVVTTRYLVGVYDPFNKEPPGDVGLAKPLSDDEIRWDVDASADLCSLLGKALIVRAYNDLKGIVMISEVWEHKCVARTVQSVQVRNQGGSTASMLIGDYHSAQVIREGMPLGFSSPSDPVAVHIVPHLIHLPASVPGGANKPWWWNEVQAAHANWLVQVNKEWI